MFQKFLFGGYNRYTKFAFTSLAFYSIANIVRSNDKVIAKEQSQKTMPIYTLQEVNQHNSINSCWVTYKGSVYDITDFIAEHPGGEDKIILAAGNDLEPFWQLYRIHTQVDAPLNLLKKYKIGELSNEEQNKQKFDDNNPYKNEPSRLNILKTHTEAPFNAETPTNLIKDEFITPNALWFVRHHHPVPKIKEEEYQLVIKNEFNSSTTSSILKLSLQELKDNFPSVEVMTTIQCAGNRRNDFNQISKTQGLPWQHGAISTAIWKGVRLSDLLKAVHFNYNPKLDEPKEAKHVWFKGIDSPYDASIPIHKAMDPRGDVIIAYEMNGVTLPRDHGYPLRAIVPGTLGARNCKFLKEIKISSMESESNWQRGIPYKGLPSNIKKLDKSIDPSQFISVQELPVQSAMTFIDRIEDEIDVSGYAYSGGGKGIARVEVSIDNGETWNVANLKYPPNQAPTSGRSWAWTLFNISIPIPSTMMNKELQMVCKATDTSFNTQPEHANNVWNIRGILNNSYHRLKIPPVQDEN